MDLPDCPPGAEGYQDSVTEVPKKPDDVTTCTKAEQEFQQHLNSLKIRTEDGNYRCMVERRGRDISGKWIYLCYPCAAMCSGESVLQTHISGKKHKSKLGMKTVWPLKIFEEHPYVQNEKGITKSAATEQVLQKMAEEVEMYKKTPSELDLKYDKYRDVLCHIQDTLDNVKAPLLGVEYLIEHPPEEAHYEPSYMCVLCIKQGHPRTIVNHLTCFWHRYNYLLRHFNKACSLLAPYRNQSKYREGVAVIMNRLALRIQDKYGRMRPVNIDKQEYEKDRDQIHQWIFKGYHFAETDSYTFEEVVDADLITSLDSSDKISARKNRDPSPPIVAAPSKPLNKYNAQRRGKRGSMESLSDVSDEPDMRTAKDKSPRVKEPKRYEPYPDRRRESPLHSRYSVRNVPSKSQEKQSRPPNYEYKVKLAQEQRAAAEQLARKALAYHEKNPEKHPLYPEEWKKFWNRRYKEIQAEGKDASKHDFKPEWIVFWTARMKELHEVELRSTVSEVYRRMRLTPPDARPAPAPAAAAPAPAPARAPPVWRSPERRRSPRRRSPEPRRRSPEPRRRSPRRASPVHRRRSPDYRKRRSIDRRSPPRRASPRPRSPLRLLRTRSRSPVHVNADREFSMTAFTFPVFSKTSRGMCMEDKSKKPKNPTSPTRNLFPLLGETITLMEEVLLVSPLKKSDTACGGTSAAGEEGFRDSDLEMDGLPKGRVRLNGAARKRLRRLLAANVQVDEARALAIKPWKEIPICDIPPDPKTRKRLTSEEESPGMQIKKALRAEKSPSFSKVVEQTRVEIRNLAPMSEDQMRLVHRALALAMLNIADKGKGPRFTGFIHRPGFIVITCEDQASLKWLSKKVPTIKPWDGAMLSIIPESELPQLVVGTIFIPSTEAESLDEAIKLLEIQNEGLNVELWRVAQSRAEGNGHVVSFFLDDSSVAALRANNFEVALGFKKLIFRINNDPRVGTFTSTAGERTQEPQPSTSKSFERHDSVNPEPRLAVAGRTPESWPRSSGQTMEPQASTSRGVPYLQGQGRGSAGSQDAAARGPQGPMIKNRGGLSNAQARSENDAWRTSRGRPRL